MITINCAIEARKDKATGRSAQPSSLQRTTGKKPERHVTFEGDEKTSSTDEDYVSASAPYEDRPKIRDEDHLKRMFSRMLREN